MEHQVALFGSGSIAALEAEITALKADIEFLKRREKSLSELTDAMDLVKFQEKILEKTDKSVGLVESKLKDSLNDRDQYLFATLLPSAAVLAQFLQKQILWSTGGNQDRTNDLWAKRRPHIKDAILEISNFFINFQYQNPILMIFWRLYSLSHFCFICTLMARSH